MDKDTELQQLFSDYHPSLNDSTNFMTTLERKLEAVEFIKRKQQAQLRRCRIVMTLTICLSVLAGLALFAIVSALPEGVRLFSFDTNFPPLTFIEQNSRMITLTIIALLIGGGIIALSDTIQKNKI
jgi:Na+/proline symporter